MRMLSNHPMPKVALLTAVGFLFATAFCPSQASETTECPQQTARVQGAKQDLPELTGLWKSDDGDIEFHILSAGKPDGSDQTVLAFFADGIENGSCRVGAPRGKFIDATFNGRRIEGKMIRCTNTEDMIKKCGMTEHYDAEFYTTSVTKDEIIGCWKTEHYAYKEHDGCPYTQDKSGDRYLKFVLTRKEASLCPDTAEVKKINEATENAATVIRVAMKVTKDSGVSHVLESSETALNNIAGGLGRVVALSEKCDALHDAMKNLRKFKDAIDEVNNAKCGPQSAAAFDHLFTSVGDLGEQFGSLEGLGPLFEILAQNETFFQDVSGALNPEQRWADQFDAVDGYTSTCPGN